MKENKNYCKISIVGVSESTSSILSEILPFYKAVKHFNEKVIIFEKDRFDLRALSAAVKLYKDEIEFYNDTKVVSITTSSAQSNKVSWNDLFNKLIKVLNDTDELDLLVAGDYSDVFDELESGFATPYSVDTNSIQFIDADGGFSYLKHSEMNAAALEVVESYLNKFISDEVVGSAIDGFPPASLNGRLIKNANGVYTWIPSLTYLLSPEFYDKESQLKVIEDNGLLEKYEAKGCHIDSFLYLFRVPANRINIDFKDLVHIMLLEQFVGPYGKKLWPSYIANRIIGREQQVRHNYLSRNVL